MFDINLIYCNILIYYTLEINVFYVVKSKIKEMKYVTKALPKTRFAY